MEITYDGTCGDPAPHLPVSVHHAPSAGGAAVAPQMRGSEGPGAGHRGGSAGGPRGSAKRRDWGGDFPIFRSILPTAGGTPSRTGPCLAYKKTQIGDKFMERLVIILVASTVIANKPTRSAGKNFSHC